LLVLILANDGRALPTFCPTSILFERHVSNIREQPTAQRLHLSQFSPCDTPRMQVARPHCSGSCDIAFGLTNMSSLVAHQTMREGGGNTMSMKRM
jgi:hypothetical protein